MYCEKCGNKLDPGDLFCPQCGTKVAETQEETAEQPEKGGMTVVAVMAALGVVLMAAGAVMIVNYF